MQECYKPAGAMSWPNKTPVYMNASVHTHVHNHVIQVVSKHFRLNGSSLLGNVKSLLLLYPLNRSKNTMNVVIMKDFI